MVGMQKLASRSRLRQPGAGIRDGRKPSQTTHPTTAGQCPLRALAGLSCWQGVLERGNVASATALAEAEALGKGQVGPDRTPPRHRPPTAWDPVGAAPKRADAAGGAPHRGGRSRAMDRLAKSDRLPRDASSARKRRKQWLAGREIPTRCRDPTRCRGRKRRRQASEPAQRR
jgi:hypothetical protein